MRAFRSRERSGSSRRVVVVVETLLPCQNLLVREISLTDVETQIIVDNIIYKEILSTNSNNIRPRKLKPRRH